MHETQYVLKQFPFFGFPNSSPHTDRRDKVWQNQPILRQGAKELKNVLFKYNKYFIDLFHIFLQKSCTFHFDMKLPQQVLQLGLKTAHVLRRREDMVIWMTREIRYLIGHKHFLLVILQYRDQFSLLTY